MIKICPSFELAHSSLSRFRPTINIGLFNADDLFSIDQDPLVNDHVCACIDVRTLLIGHGRKVSAERGTVVDRVARPGFQVCACSLAPYCRFRGGLPDRATP